VSPFSVWGVCISEKRYRQNKKINSKSQTVILPGIKSGNISLLPGKQQSLTLFPVFPGNGFDHLLGGVKRRRPFISIQFQCLLGTYQGADPAADAFFRIDNNPFRGTINGQRVEIASSQTGSASHAVVSGPGNKISRQKCRHIIPASPAT